jgi:hypothetical protein
MGKEFLLHMLRSMILYRYNDFIGGIKTLEQSALKATRPIDFNDPFEYLIRMSVTDFRGTFRKSYFPSFSAQDLESLVEEQLRKDGVERPTKKQRRGAGLEVRQALMLKFKEEVQDGLDVKSRSLLPKLSRTTGVTCFSSNSNNNLMWSHYAEGHRGIMIEVDLDSAFEVYSKKPQIIEVNYGSAPPVIQFWREGGIDNSRTPQSAVLGCKSADWAYEGEYRIQFNLDVLRNGGGEGQREILLFDIPRDSIRRVILGCKVDASGVDRVKDILSGEGYEHVDLQRAETPIDSYQLIYRDLGNEVS